MTLILDARETALVIIDLQQGITSMPVAPHDAKSVIANAVRLAQALRKAGGLVVPVHVAFSADGADRLQQPVDEPAAMPASIPASWSELVPEIQALAGDVVITKRQWSAFHGTELDLQLRRRGVTTIVLCGIATNFGVESTARDAWQYGYSVVVAEDACASRGADMHAFAIERILPRVSRVRKTEEILKGLSS